MRIDYGPAYRVYYRQRCKVLIILLCAGDKSTQRSDIRGAHELAKREDCQVATTRFDAAAYLAEPEAQAEFLAATLEDGTPDEIRAAINTIARARGMSELARATGIRREQPRISLRSCGYARCYHVT